MNITRKQAIANAAAAVDAAVAALSKAEKSHRGTAAARNAVDRAEANFRVVSGCGDEYDVLCIRQRVFY